VKPLAALPLLLILPLAVAETDSTALFLACEISAVADDNYRCFGEIAGRTGAWSEAADRLEHLASGDADNPLVWWALGYVRQNQRDISQAEAAYLRAADLFADRDNPQQVSLLLYLFHLLLDEGRTEEALAVVERGARAAEQTGDPLLLAHAAVSRASAASSLDRYGEAERLLLGAQEWVETEAPAWLLSRWLKIMGHVRWTQGLYAEARDVYARSAELNRRAGNYFDEANDRYALALTVFEDGDAARRERFQDVLELSRRTGNRLTEASSLIKLGWIAEDPVEGRSLIRRGVALHASSGSAQGVFDSRLELAGHLASEEPVDFEQAFELFNEILDDATARGQYLNAARADFYTSFFLWQRVKRVPDEPRWRKLAIEANRRSIRNIETVRNLQLDTLARARTLKYALRVFEVLVGWLLREDTGRSPEDVAMAFDTLERMRARVLLDELDAAGAGSSGEGPLADERAGVLRQIATVQRRLLQADLASDERPEQLGRLEQLELEERDLRGRLAAENPVVALVRRPQLATLRDVQESLRKDEALLSFQISDWTHPNGFFLGGSWVLVVTATDVNAYRISDKAELDPALEMYRSVLRDTGSSPAKGSARLYRELFGEAFDDLPQHIRRLIVVPDGALHGLPFGTLRASPGSLPLAMEYEINLVPSATLWRRWRLQKRPGSRAPALAFADPRWGASEEEATEVAQMREWALDSAVELGGLPFARREGKSIVRRLGGNSELLTGTDASEARLKSLDLDRFDILHFAAHATIDHDRPERSGVLLSPGNATEDGLLQMREIVELKLDGQTVILSACRSAAGKLMPGEGVMGLAQAFFVGGARTVVGSLWPLKDDEAAVFFDAFYRHLARGSSAGAALTGARRERIEAGASDASWAGIVLLGDGSFVPFPGGRPASRMSPIWIGVLLLAVVVSGALLLRRRAPAV